MTLEPGRHLLHYRLTEKIGEGGMGVVWRAIDTKLERDVAIKILPREFVDDPRRLARFEREAKTVAALDHPNIVTIHAVEEEEGVRFFAMELVRGDSLHRCIPQEGMPLERLLALAVPLADALSAAHDHNIIHRDLKPANIMVTADGRVKILDFGLAKLRDQESGEASPRPPTESPTEPIPLTEAGGVLGTVPYMSPEQVEGKPLDHRSDLFSLGIVLYQMATGRLPFEGDSRSAVSASILRDEPPLVDELRPELPGDLGRIVGHCLRKDPELRYQTAKGLRNELEELRQGRRPEPRRRRIKRAPGSRNVVRLGLVVTVAVLLVLAAMNLDALRELVGDDSSSDRIEALAILPLENISGDPDQEYIAHGMTEALITELAKIGDLKIISRTSVMQYKGVNKPLREIGEELGVDAVVEGSVLRDGDRIRISAQLIDARSDEHVWADSYDRDLRDVLGLQREVARTIAETIHVRLTPENGAEAERSTPIGPAAYEAYLKGQYYSAKMTADGFLRALSFFEEAIEMEPDYAPAHAGAASSYHLLAGFSAIPPEEGYERARAAAMRTLELDDRNAEAHKALAVVAFEYDWDWESVDREYRRALKLNPNYAIGRADYAWSMSKIGRHEAAIDQARLAYELSPLSLAIGVLVGETLLDAGRDDEAIEQLDRVVEMDPHFVRTHSLLAVAYERKGMLEDSIAASRKTVELSGNSVLYRARLARILALAGDDSEALRMLDELTERARTEYVPPIAFALIHMGLGNHEQSIDWLEKVYQERSIYMITTKISILFDPLRSEPRFQELLARMNFPDR